jgi:hypothetical protein
MMKGLVAAILIYFIIWYGLIRPDQFASLLETVTYWGDLILDQLSTHVLRLGSD